MTTRRARLAIACALTAGLLGCSSASTTPTPPPVTQALYVGNLAGPPPLGEILFPFSASSTVTTASPAAVTSSVDLAFDSAGNIYVSSGTQVFVFAHPLTSASTPVATINLPAATNATWILIDSGNNLWVSDNGNTKVYKFTPPFSGTITPAPAITLSTSLSDPVGLAFDGAGNLYVGDGVTQTVQIYTAPIVNNQSPTATPLTGATSCRGIVFDPAGNLYAGSLSGSIERYNAPTAGGGAPSIIDPGAITTHSYFLAMDAQGNLYVDDGISTNKVYQFAAVATTFSATSAPTTSLTLTGFTTASGLALGPP